MCCACVQTRLPSRLAPPSASHRQEAAIWEISLRKKGQTWQQTLYPLSSLPSGQLWRSIKEMHHYPTGIYVTDFNHDFSPSLWPAVGCVGDLAATRNGTRTVGVWTGVVDGDVCVRRALSRPETKCLWSSLVGPRFVPGLGIGSPTANGKRGGTKSLSPTNCLLWSLICLLKTHFCVNL